MLHITHDDSQKIEEKILREWTSEKRETKTIVSFCFLTIFFVVLGIVLAAYTSKAQILSIRYDADCGDPQENSTCIVTVVFNEKFQAPVYFYYELDNFFQNHRTYLNSRDLPQLKGEVRSAHELENCKPVVYNRDLYDIQAQKFALDGTPLEPNSPASPCGLIARSLFNDTYAMTSKSGAQIKINEKGIAWKSDVEDMYKQPNNYMQTQWTDVTDEHFMVWMRPAGLSNFRKLWGVIETDIQEGEYNVAIVNNYDVDQFDGRKSVVFQTVNAFGGKNTLLTVCYFIAAAVCFVVTAYFSLQVFRKRKNK